MTIQRVHGDLHVGQVLRWPGGLVVVDFHPNPVVELAGLSVSQAMAPAARDIARLLRSLDHVARVVDKGTGFAMTPAVDAWSESARTMLLDTYRLELESAGHPELLDERLVQLALRGRAALPRDRLCRPVPAELGLRPAGWAVAVVRGHPPGPGRRPVDERPPRPSRQVVITVRSRFPTARPGWTVIQR